ncbi:MAG: rhomboid family intramembrane serine protease [Pirellulales bacterium]|nr:rhomboid family intramembrane serine protease [Pirellulales bacterium]
MGLYDRDYGRDDHYGSQPGFHLGARGPLTLTTKIVLLTFGIYVLQLLTQPARPEFVGDYGWVTKYFSVYTDSFQRPWLWFQLLSYGFLHDLNDFRHIVFNMLGLWMFGRTVESRYGQREYLAFYLIAIVFAGTAWCLSEVMVGAGRDTRPMMYGASGGLSAVLILFAINYPRQRIYIWGIFGVPAWLFAMFFVGSDLLGAMDRTSNVACTAHLGGSLFAGLYFYFGWNLSQRLPRGWSLPRTHRRHKLRVHDPDESPSETDQVVDELLRKIQQHGQDSLTQRERRILERASRDYQRKKK